MNKFDLDKLIIENRDRQWKEVKNREILKKK